MCQAKLELRQADSARKHLRLIQEELVSLQRELPALRQAACSLPEAAGLLHQKQEVLSTVETQLQDMRR